MEAYKERFAARLEAELIRRGEQPRDLANALNIEKRTVERWVERETYPQRRHLKAAADALGISVDELRPDLEAEAKRMQDQLDRVEGMLLVLLSRTGAPADQIEEELQQAVEQARKRADDNGRVAPGRDSEAQ